MLAGARPLPARRLPSTSPSPASAANPITNSALLLRPRRSTSWSTPAVRTPMSQRCRARKPPKPNPERAGANRKASQAGRRFRAHADRTRRLRRLRLQDQPARSRYLRRRTGRHAWTGFPATRQLVVNMTSASGGSRAALEKPNRVVITATKRGNEKNATVFARYWVEALRDTSRRHRQERNRFGARSVHLRRAENQRSSTRRKSAWPPNIPCWRTPAKATARASRRPKTARA